MTTKTTYKVGDKVRILDAKKIQFGSSYWNDGDIAEVKRVLDDGLPCLARNDMKRFDRGLPLYSRELKYIEKVAEQVAKFKVGDKVRIIKDMGGIAGVKIGTVATVIEVDSDGDVRVDVINKNGVPAFFIAHEVELISPKLTKNQRITALEKTVADLQAEVEAVKATQKSPTMTVKADVDVAKIAESLAKAFEKHSPNEQRKAIIDEAKAFVEELSGIIRGTHKRETKFGRLNDVGYTYVLKPEFHINSKKRTVTVLMKGAHYDNGKVYAKGIEKCAPEDVFNADIGKAIALGHALGLDVKRFEQAVQPREVVVGDVVRTKYEFGGYNDSCPTNVIGITAEGYPKFKNGTYSSAFEIKDDTEVQY